MSFSVSTGTGNEVTKQNLSQNVTLTNQGIFTIQGVANATAAGNTAVKDLFTGEDLVLEADDIVTYILAIGTNLLPATGNIAIGTSLTSGGDLANQFISNTVALLTNAISDPIDTRINPQTTGTFVTVNLSGGVSGGNVRIVLSIWRRSLT